MDESTCDLLTAVCGIIGLVMSGESPPGGGIVFKMACLRLLVIVRPRRKPEMIDLGAHLPMPFTLY